MNTFKKVSYAWIWVLTAASASISNAGNATDWFGYITKANPVKDNWKLANEWIDTSIWQIIGRLLMFLWLIAVIYALWGGFLILTAAWNDDQVKKGRQVIVHAIIGIIVIFLSYSIINWVLQNITSEPSNS